MIIGTLLTCGLFMNLVGKDGSGNSYYSSYRPNRFGKFKRMVLYKGLPDPAVIPPLWHGWLHHVYDDIPKQKNSTIGTKNRTKTNSNSDNIGPDKYRIYGYYTPWAA